MKGMLCTCFQALVGGVCAFGSIIIASCEDDWWTRTTGLALELHLDWDFRPEKGEDDNEILTRCLVHWQIQKSHH